MAKAPKSAAKPARKPAKKASTQKAAHAVAKKNGAAARAAHDAARGKLERVRVPSSSRREDGAEGKYVYCVIRSDQPLSFGPLGLGPEPAQVHTIHFRDICAVVSNTPMVVQDPTRATIGRQVHHAGAGDPLVGRGVQSQQRIDAGRLARPAR